MRFCHSDQAHHNVAGGQVKPPTDQLSMTESERVDNNVSSTGLRRNFGSVGVGARYAPSAWLGHWQSASSRSLHDDRVLALLKNSDGMHKCDSCFGSHPSQPKGGKSCVCLCKGLERSGLAAGSVTAAVVEEVDASRWQGVVT